MPTPMRRRLRLARRGVGYAVAIVLVLVALLLGAASQVLPLAERHPDRIAAWLSARAGRPVAFDRVETAWTRRGPLLKLDNLRIGDAGEAFEVGDAEVLVSVYEGLLPGQALSELRLRGLDMTLERATDGRWQVRGLPGQQRSAEELFDMLQSLGELQVVGGRLAIDAPDLGIQARVERVNLRLQVGGDAVRAAVRAWRSDGAMPLDATLRFSRRSGGGMVHAGADDADLAAWSPVLRVAGVTVSAGRGRAEAWAHLAGGRVTRVTVETALDGVELSAREPDDATSPVRFERVAGKARWLATPDGWRLDVPALRTVGDAGEQRLDAVTVAGGRRFALLADRLDTASLLQVVALSDRLDPGLRQWVTGTRPEATLGSVRIAGRVGGAMRASAQVDGLAFRAVGDGMGLSGLGGRFEGDADGFTFVPDAHAPVRLDWPSGFGVSHVVKLDGTVAGWRDGEGWRIGTGALRIDGGSFAADARGGLWWQGDGSRPWIDLAVDIDDAQVPVAKGFWVRHRMPEAAVQWLDDALQGGVVRGGQAVISGDLDDWPFVHGDGLFEAKARIEGGVIAFRPGWPAVEKLDADVAFVGDGFSVEGHGELKGIAIPRIEAGIDHYAGGRLAVDATGEADARDLLELLRDSPLRETAGDTLAHIDARGPAKVGFALRLPLHHDRPMSIGGTVDVVGARIAEDRWNVVVEDVDGRARFDHEGFHADALSVRFDGLPGTLALRTGQGHVQEAANAFEAVLSGDLDTRALLERAPEMAWLKPYVAGHSDWRVGVDVPKGSGDAGPPSRLRLTSDLVGTRLDLPEPLSKPAGESLASAVDVPLPLGSGDLRVALGNRVGVRVRTAGGRAGVRVVLGRGEVVQAPPAHGLVAGGHARRLDAIDWIALARGGGEGGLPLVGIDIVAERLQLLGGQFPQTTVKVVPQGDGSLDVQTAGERLQGRLTVPKEASEPITGQFARVHWQPVPKEPVPGSADGDAAGERTAVAAADAGGEDAFNPAAIPPLAIDVDDLRVKDADLGHAMFRSRPGADGMRIDALQTRAGRQSVDVSGEWNGRGADARTSLVAELRSEDFGALFTGLGMGNVIAEGKGTVRFEGGWPGNPAAFSPGMLEGRLAIDSKDGQLLELEPGAGRMLGLLSVTQLPRRLMLDFGDLFSKGFAYNELKGEVVFADGRARTDDLRIEGPAATITVSGTTDMRRERFDQTVEVRPKAGNLLTAVGAIAGGPVGAAIGAAANVVLEKPIGQITGKTYRVTGPWKDPKIEARNRVPQPVPGEPAPPSG